MALTAITLTGTFTKEDGTAAQGTVTATLSTQIQNGTTVIEPTPIVGELNGEGKLLNAHGKPLTLYANDDAATTPGGSYYSFLIVLGNTPAREFNAVIKHAASEGKVDISELETPV